MIERGKTREGARENGSDRDDSDSDINSDSDGVTLILILISIVTVTVIEMYIEMAIVIIKVLATAIVICDECDRLGRQTSAAVDSNNNSDRQAIWQ